VPYERHGVNVLAFDFGSKRTGVALGDKYARSTRAITTLSSGSDMWGQIAHLLRQYSPSHVVVGWPRGLDGQHTSQTHAAEEFAHELEERYGVRVVLQDEALSSEEAQRRIDPKLPIRKQRELIDAIAAQVILEDYMREKH
jgi:putative Holliday junction resolvase